MRSVTATLPDGTSRIRSIDGKPDFILSVLDTTDPDLNKALRKGFTATPVVRAVFGNADAAIQRDWWAGQSELLERLRPKVNRSFCKPDGLSKMLIDKLAAHQNLLEKLCRQSPLELAKPKAPPPGSLVSVHFDNGRDYEAIVTEADETRATVKFNDDETMAVTFPDPAVRVTHVEPPPPPPRRSKKRKSDDESDDEPPAKRARQSKKKRGSSGSGDEPASKRRRTYSEPDDDGWDDELPELPEPDKEDGWD